MPLRRRRPVGLRRACLGRSASTPHVAELPGRVAETREACANSRMRAADATSDRARCRPATSPLSRRERHERVARHDARRRSRAARATAARRRTARNGARRGHVAGTARSRATLNVCPNHAAQPATAPAACRGTPRKARAPASAARRTPGSRRRAGRRAHRRHRASRTSAPAPTGVSKTSFAAPAMQPARCAAREPAAEPQQVARVQDHRPRRLLDPVAVPALRRAYLRVLRAQLARRAHRVQRRRRLVRAAQRDPVVVECALRAVGRVARAELRCTRSLRGRSSRGSRA